MKLLAQLLCLCTVSGILYLAVYAYHQRIHPDLEHGYSKSDSDKVSGLLDSPKPVILHRDKLVTVNALAYLYGYDPDTAYSLPFKARRK